MYILLGKNGYIAEAIIKQLKTFNLNYVALSRSDIDYTNKALLDLYILKNFHKNILSEEKIFIINAAGYVGKPNVDACESNKEETIEGNVALPLMLSQLCADRNYTFVHISSGCIYNGYSKIFTEEDEPNFNFKNGSFYSGSKALAEKLVLQNNPLSYILRLRIPFDEYNSPRNYINKILNYEVLLDVENSLTHRQDFAKALLFLTSTNSPFGIYNITNAGSITTKEVVALIKEHLNINKEFKYFSNLDKFMQEVVTPRSNCVLSNSKASKICSQAHPFAIRDVREALEDALSKYKIK